MQHATSRTPDSQLYVLHSPSLLQYLIFKNYFLMGLWFNLVPFLIFSPPQYLAAFYTVIFLTLSCFHDLPSPRCFSRALL